MQSALDQWVQRPVLPVVYLNYKGAIDTTAIRSLREILRERWIAATAGAPISEPLSRSQVRFFYTTHTDSVVAQEIATIANRYFEGKGCSAAKFTARYTPGYEGKARPGAYELYLLPGCQ